MQLVAKYDDANEYGEGVYPVLVVHNSMGHRLGSFTLDSRSYDMIENALAVAQVAIQEYNTTGSMVAAIERAYNESLKFN